MSTVMRPRGPLPGRIYWARRALLGIVALAVIGLAWWLMPGGSTSSTSADLNGSSPTGGQAPVVHPGSPTSAVHPHPPTSSLPKKPAPAPTTADHTTAGSTIPPARSAPTGTCAPAVVLLEVAATSAPPGNGSTVRYTMSTTDGSTCSLGITASLLETKIASAQGLAWHSDACPDELPAKNVVVRPQPAVLYSFHWDGYETANTCGDSGKVAPPRRYQVSAALIGGQPHGTYFWVTEPAATP